MFPSSVAHRWSSCEITWKNLDFSLLTLAKRTALQPGRTRQLVARSRTAEAAKSPWILLLAALCSKVRCRLYSVVVAVRAAFVDSPACCLAPLCTVVMSSVRLFIVLS
jgi:hypothetical protein